ncbi:hypothetical protein P7L74_00530 (plasmid) [Tistrella mobilis]
MFDIDGKLLVQIALQLMPSCGRRGRDVGQTLRCGKDGEPARNLSPATGAILTAELPFVGQQLLQLCRLEAEQNIKPLRKR